MSDAGSRAILPSSRPSRPVWMVTDQLPYPPRNGITLPVANYLDGLRRRHDVRLILFVDAAHPPAPDAVACNEALYGPVTQVPLVRESPLLRAADELMRRGMYYHGWRPVPGSVPLTPPPGLALIVSPMSAVAKWRKLHRPGDGAASVSIAAVNDCTAAQYWHRGKQVFGGGPWRGLMDRGRTRNIARIERRILVGYDHILLQTRSDLELMRRLAGEDVARRVTLAPNGVRAELLSVVPNRRSRHVALVSELSGEYGPVARWLVGEVWPKVLLAQPDAILRVIGRGADHRLVALMNATPHVSYVPFVDDLAEVYRNTLVVVSPVFKGYGLINKTIEAMAAGIPVVGGASAFNGLEGFVSGRDGIRCATREATRFAEAITGLVQDAALCETIGESGRAQVRGRFAWATTIHTLETLLSARGQEGTENP